jgi:ERF superfamily protein
MTERSEQINELAAALAKAQAKFKHVSKDKTAKIEMRAGGSYTYRYADLGNTWDTGRAALTENGLSVVQSPSYEDGWLSLETMLLHASGQFICSTMKTRASENDVKSLGSAITYLRRYAFAAMIGLVADEDDDGDASNASQQRAQRQAPLPANGTRNAAAQPIDQRRDRLIARFELTLDEARSCGIKLREYDPARMTDEALIEAGTELKKLIADSKAIPIAERK